MFHDFEKLCRMKNPANVPIPLAVNRHCCAALTKRFDYTLRTVRRLNAHRRTDTAIRACFVDASGRQGGRTMAKYIPVHCAVFPIFQRSKR
jgi:hypothetical protein